MGATNLVHMFGRLVSYKGNRRNIICACGHKFKQEYELNFVINVGTIFFNSAIYSSIIAQNFYTIDILKEHSDG